MLLCDLKEVEWRAAIVGMLEKTLLYVFCSAISSIERCAKLAPTPS